MNLHEPLQLQRLIDGECSAEEARQWLSVAQHDTQQSQQMALSLCTDRIWLQQFKSEFESLSDPVSGPATGTAPATPAGAKNRNDRASFGGSATNQQAIIRKPGISAQPNWLAIAASALLAAMIGYGAGQNYSSITSVSNPLENGLAVSDLVPELGLDHDSISNAFPNTVPKITPASLQADYRLQLPAEHGSGLRGEVPLYVVQTPEQWDQINQPENSFQFSPDMIRQLQANGFRVRQQVNYLAGNLEDGRTFMVPIRSINFSHGQ